MHNWNIPVIKIIVGVSFVFSGFNVQSQAIDSLTVEDAVAYALRNNYDILLSKNDSAVSAIDNEYRNAAFYPRVNGTGTLLFNNNAQRQTLADGSQRKSDGIKTTNLTAAINLNWTVFDGFRMFLLRDQLDVRIKQGSLTIKNAVVNTVAAVVNTYYDIVRQKQQLVNVQEQIQLASDRLQLAQYKFDIGAGIKPDVLQAQIDLNNSKASQINQITLIDQRKQTLNQLMNVATSTDYKVSDTILVKTDIVLGDLLNNLAESNPQLQLARTNMEVAALNIKLAKASRYPIVSLLSAYNFSRSSNNTVINQFQPLFNLNRGFNYGLTASIPILNNFAVRQQIRQAELSSNFQQLQYESQESFVNTSLLTSFKNYEGQKKIIAILDSNLALTRENLFIEKERYRLGRTTYIELRTAEQNVANVITDLINARYNLKTAETELLRLRGELVR